MADEHNINLLYWMYNDEINNYTVKLFLDNNKILYDDNLVDNDDVSDIKNIMAPVLDNSIIVKNIYKDKQRSSINNLYQKYSVTGELLKEYKTLKEAADDVKISQTSIRKVLNGERKTAGGFGWKKIDV